MASHLCSKNVKGSVLGFDLASKGKGARVLYNKGEMPQFLDAVPGEDRVQRAKRKLRELQPVSAENARKAQLERGKDPFILDPDVANEETFNGEALTPVESEEIKAHFARLEANMISKEKAQMAEARKSIEKASPSFDERVQSLMDRVTNAKPPTPTAEILDKSEIIQLSEDDLEFVDDETPKESEFKIDGFNSNQPYTAEVPQESWDATPVDFEGAPMVTVRDNNDNAARLQRIKQKSEVKRSHLDALSREGLKAEPLIFGDNNLKRKDTHRQEVSSVISTNKDARRLAFEGQSLKQTGEQLLKNERLSTLSRPRESSQLGENEDNAQIDQQMDKWEEYNEAPAEQPAVVLAPELSKPSLTEQPRGLKRLFKKFGAWLGFGAAVGGVGALLSQESQPDARPTPPGQATKAPRVEGSSAIEQAKQQGVNISFDAAATGGDKALRVIIEGPAEPIVKELYETAASNRTPEVIVEGPDYVTYEMPVVNVGGKKKFDERPSFREAVEASPYGSVKSVKVENPYTDVAQEVSNFDKKKIGTEYKYRTLGGKTVYDNGDGLFEEISGGTVRYGYSGGRIESIALKYGNAAPVIIGVEPSGKLTRQVASASEWERRIADMQDTLNRVSLLKGSN